MRTVNYNKKINRGMAYLDKHHPGWENKVDTNRLDLLSIYMCVLGQVYLQEERAGDFRQAMFDLVTRHRSKYLFGWIFLLRRPAWSVVRHYGFSIPGVLHGTFLSFYGNTMESEEKSLRSQWVVAIKRHRLEAAQRDLDAAQRELDAFNKKVEDFFDRVKDCPTEPALV
jgi:hypothetical protein